VAEGAAGGGRAAGRGYRGRPFRTAGCRRRRKSRGGAKKANAGKPAAGRPSALLDTRAIYCGDCLEQLKNLRDACVDLIYIDPPFNSNPQLRGVLGRDEALL